MKYDKLRDGLIDIFNSMGYTIKLYNDGGKSISNPYNARYIFIDNPNMMFIIDDASNLVEMHRSNFNFNTFKKLIGMIRKITKKYFIRLSVSTYNQVVTPKTFSRDVLRRKTNFSIKMVESVTGDTNQIVKPMIISEFEYSDDNSNAQQMRMIINKVKLDVNETSDTIGEVLAESYIKGLISEKDMSDLIVIVNSLTEPNQKVQKLITHLNNKLKE